MSLMMRRESSYAGGMGMGVLATVGRQHSRPHTTGVPSTIIQG